MEKQTPYRVDRLETLAQLDALEKEWADLIAEIPQATVFMTWEWIRTWWSYFSQGRELWLLTARDEQGGLRGIAPFMKELQRTGWIKLRTLSFIGAGVTVQIHQNILTYPSDQQDLPQAFMDFLMRHSDQWDVISLACVAQDSALFGLFAGAGRCFRTGNKKPSAYISLPENWDVYLKTLKKKLRRNLKYFRSKLDKDYPGGVYFSRVTDPDDLTSAMERLEELNKDRWHSKERISNFDHPNYAAFHQAIASLALDRGWLRLYQLIAAKRVIALCYNFLFHERIYANAIAFDLDARGYSPGRLAIAHAVQSAIQEGAHEYDWLSGQEDYKLAWTDQIRVEEEILFSNNWLGCLWLAWRGFSGVFKEFLTAKARQWLPQSTRDRINQFVSRRYKMTKEKSGKDSE